MTDEHEKKFRDLEKQIMRLESVVDQLRKRIDYLDRERQRTKSDVHEIASHLRK
jgi:peptidoglycan hydrolase CwlO-like protein